MKPREILGWAKDGTRADARFVWGWRGRDNVKKTRERERELDMGHVHVHVQVCLGARGAPAGYGELERARHTSDYLPYQRKWLEARGEGRDARGGAARCSCRMFWKESVNVTGPVSNSAICETRMVYGLVPGVACHWSLPYDGMQY